MGRLFVGCRELGCSDPPFHHLAFTLDQFQFGKAQQIAPVIDALLGALTGNLVILGQDCRKLELLEMVPQQDLGICCLTLAHAVVLSTSAA